MPQFTDDATSPWVLDTELDAALADADTDAADAITATLGTSGKGFCNHGATAGTSRPVGFVSVEWAGSVEPTNALNGDTWIDTTT